MRDLLKPLLLTLLLVLGACNLSNVPPTPTPTPPPLPTTRFLFPDNESIVVEGTALDIDILASDDQGSGVVRVELLADDQLVKEGAPNGGQAVSPFRVQMNWLAQGIGRHTLTAIAYRADGTPSDPTTILVNIIPLDEATEEVIAQP